ncbi:ATP-dependent DNA helicase, Rep family [Actinokineospora alba]|uniref:DNA 3'-5' helicase n=1 Tax=Actinokineospora alba TaxID=504798 RepID=A0A1H0LHS8_9PSEU|nr:ATP-dependent DNA helicase UvrD2 [Actinokineospora alba]TDP67327.1 Rep family ATP-dependent DNA helicase [Actinokineospora alba]SDJ00352.1 DNA helicase-2 / ATP-dependent DNA helicase PcrA [Actinokineospora alba]SDO67561.1 ATP-dependent DNA helicase, Rep family [Actinokineospora alba]
MAGAPDPLDGLDPDQLAAVTAPRGPVCVLAGAGTGKTRTIVSRIAHLIHAGHVSAGQVLAVTFTARAAGEMRTRLRALDIHAAQARTFHAAALRQLRYFWPRVVGGEQWELIDGKLRLVSQVANKLGLGTERETLRDLASEIEWAKASLIAPADYPAAVARFHRETPAPAEKVAEVYTGYEALKNRANQLDFDDLLLHTAAALEEHSAVAEEFRDRYRCFVVDEYQDVTPLQQRVLDAWLGRRDDLTVVGDANQTIYSFAGASARPLLDFTRRFPEATVVRLERDYRSTPEVVSLANRVISAARDRPAGSRLRLIGQRKPGPDPVFVEYDDEPAEATAVAGRIKDLIEQGVALSEIAVLFRINAQSEVYEQALTELGIPYLVRGGERFFNRQEIRQATAALRTAAVQSPTGELPKLVRGLLEPLGLTADPPAGGAARERWESLLALVELAEELAATVADADLARYVHELELRAQAQHPPTVEGVTLASLHSAKGLEWDAVFLVGLVDGTLPIQHADGNEAQIEEERRLLYVGVTRAREHLSLTWALARAEGGKRYRRRSRFLYGLIPENHPTARVAASATRRRDRGMPMIRHCRVCGDELAGTMAFKLGRCETCPVDLDHGLLDRLKQWRLERSKALRVPVYVIFTDATLLAIAEQCPADRAALVSISGVGAVKLDKFGQEVLSVVANATRSSGM